MTYIVMAIVLIGSALFQVTVPAYALFGQAKCPFLLAAVLYYALTRDTSTTLVAALAAGTLQDTLTPMMPLGHSVLVFCAAGWITGLFRRMVLAESSLTAAMFGAAAGAAVTAALCALLLRQGLIACSMGRAALKVVSSGALAALCTPLVFAFALRLDRLVGNVAMRESIDGFE